MKEIKRIGGKWWLLLLISLLIGIYLFSRTPPTLTMETHQQVSSTGTISYDHISNYPGLHLELETEETDMYTMSVSIPTVNIKEIDLPIQIWIKQEILAFKNEMENYNKEASVSFLDDGHLNIQLQTSKYSKHIYSLVFHAFQFTGGANGIQSVQPFVIHMKEGKILDISHIIDFDDKEGLEHFKNDLVREVKSNEQIIDYLDQDALDQALKNLHDLKWSIDEDSLYIYFNEYEIAQGTAEEIQVELSLDLLEQKGVLLPFQNEGKSALKNDIENEEDIVDEEEVINNQEGEPKNKNTKEDDVSYDPNKKYIALTFDDGPNPSVTPQILKTLEKFNARSTFFMLGSQVEFYPTVAKQVKDAGHEIASHSYNHPDLTKLGFEQMKDEVNETTKQIKRATGVEPTLFRPPYGTKSDSLLNYLDDHGYALILWSVDSLDWKMRNAEKIQKTVLDHVTNGSIILFHDIYQETAESLPWLLEKLQKQGYEFITVSEMLDLHEQTGVGPYTGVYKK